jgi:GNAT superfamily N-acetyltransferase
VAVDGGAWLGLVTYHVDDDSCEIATIDSDRPNQGVGTALIEAVSAGRAARPSCRRLWLVTTNDNTAALRFYQINCAASSSAGPTTTNAPGPLAADEAGDPTHRQRWHFHAR